MKIKLNANTSSPEVRVDIDGRREIVDPDEERYCICGDVSYGEMICCEFDEKVGHTPMMHLESVANLNVSANSVSGFTWTASSWLSCHQGLSNGTVQEIGRSITKESTRMDLLAEASSNRTEDERCHHSP